MFAQTRWFVYREFTLSLKIDSVSQSVRGLCVITPHQINMGRPHCRAIRFNYVKCAAQTVRKTCRVSPLGADCTEQITGIGNKFHERNGF